LVDKQRYMKSHSAYLRHFATFRVGERLSSVLQEDDTRAGR